jgi:thiol:disulfide interchange protein
MIKSRIRIMRRQNQRSICVKCALLLALLFTLPAFAEPKTQIRLLLSAETARPGDVIWAGLQMDMPQGWHTYWRNGGDAGQATEIKWTLPEGITAGQINWPVPAKEIDTAGDSSLVTYIYTNQVVLLVPLTLDKSLRPGRLTITAATKWMECSDICNFGGGDATTTLTIGDEAKPSSDVAIIETWRKKVPQPDTNSAITAYWESTPPKDNARELMIEWKAKASSYDFYPYANTNFEMGGMTETLPGSAAPVLRKIVKKNGDEWPKQIDGILAVREGSGGWEEHLKIQAPAAVTAPQPKVPVQTASLVTMLLLAFVGGLILNVMPCVLPVIALKILGFVNQSKEEPRRVRQLGAVYGLGVLVSFLVLAGLAIGVQSAGGVANWGDAIRNPQFQVIITVLMTLVALNLFGIFEVTLSGKVMGAASELSGKSGFPGAFFNGVLATLLATPCTAPFLGPALAFSFAQPPLVILLFFLVAGLGLALPFVVLCWNPRLLKLLPKPGGWMEKFKNFMGFPMLATVVWLMWVSSSKENDELWLGLFLVVVALAAWIWGEFVQRGTSRRALAVVICLLLLGADYGVILEGQLHWRSPDQTNADGIAWKVWSPEAVEEARRAGHPVLVDFTAKSCVNCHLNFARAIDIAATRTKLKQIGAVTLKADFTRQDPAIAQELRRFNTTGVPLVLIYSKDLGQEPQVLPTYLTPAIVLDALDKAAK